MAAPDLAADRPHRRTAGREKDASDAQRRRCRRVPGESADLTERRRHDLRTAIRHRASRASRRGVRTS